MISLIEQGRSLSRDAASAEVAVREASTERRWVAVEIAEAPSVIFEEVAASAEVHFASLRNTFNFLIDFEFAKGLSLAIQVESLEPN